VALINIQKFLSDDIERIQKRALKIIVPNSTFKEALEITGITIPFMTGGKDFVMNSLNKILIMTK
jgi:hypothetical protein